MAITVKHSKVSLIPDAGDASLVEPSDWNADHVLTGTVPITNGGTGASDATTARTNLGAASSGANTDITSLGGLTGGIDTPDYLQLDTVATASIALGKLRWNATTATAAFGIVDGTIECNIGEQMYAYVTNAETTTILKGQAVYLYRATGNRASVKLAYNTSDATSAKTLGLATQDIAAGATGFVTTQGTLDKLDTSAFTEGDTLYLGATAGSLTATKPKAPNHLVYIGVVERSNAGNGQIYVRPQNGYELDEIHDVQINSPANGQTIIYDATNSLWKNANITAGSGISVTNGASSITIANTSPMAFPSSGIAVSTGSAWGTSLTAPSGSIVGTTDTQTLSNKTLTGTKETVYAITDGAAFEIDPANGGIQTITLGANRTPKGTNFTAGQSVTLMVTAGSYTLTWTDTTFGTSGVNWTGGFAPTLSSTGISVIELWKVGTQVYGALVGFN